MPDFAPEDFSNAYYDGGEDTPLELADHPTPKTYLQFAIADLEEPATERSWVNSLSNAKRALHFQIEIISRALGFELAHGNRAPFPERLEFCTNCGVVGPRILRKLNRLRNAIEHDYYIPAKDEAEDFVDVVQLFLAATSRLLYRFPSNPGFVSEKCNTLDGADVSVDIELPPHRGEIKINISAFGGEVPQTISMTRSVSNEHADYCRWVAFALQKSDS